MQKCKAISSKERMQIECETEKIRKEFENTFMQMQDKEMRDSLQNECDEDGYIVLGFTDNGFKKIYPQEMKLGRIKENGCTYVISFKLKDIKDRTKYKVSSFKYAGKIFVENGRVMQKIETVIASDSDTE